MKRYKKIMKWLSEPIGVYQEFDDPYGQYPSGPPSNLMSKASCLVVLILIGLLVLIFSL